MFFPKHYKSRSQDLKEAYHDAGQFYWAATETWLKNKPIISRNSTPLLIPRYRAMDIDTIEDWLIAEKMFEALHKKKNDISS